METMYTEVGNGLDQTVNLHWKLGNERENEHDWENKGASNI